MTREQRLNNVVGRPLDQRIISKLSKGWGDPIDYISGTSMLVLLREAFGPYYSIEYSEPKIVTYADTESKKGVVHATQVVEVKCTLTVPMKDPETGETIMVKREGFGSASMKPKFEEMVLKSAQTDSLKKAAYSFGFALELSAGKGDKTSELSWFNENMFGAWTKDLANFYRNEWELIKGYMEGTGIKDFNMVAKHILNDPNAHLTPDNINAVAQGILEQESEKNESSDN